MTKKTKFLLGIGLLLAGGWCFGGSASATTFTVTNTSDSGAGSFRQAVLDANADVNVPHTITFAIPGAGQHTIGLQSNIPAITQDTLIDGKTQPGSPLFCDTNGTGDVPRIVLKNESANQIQLYRNAGLSVRGIAFTSGVTINSNGPSDISCNFFGTTDGTTVDAPLSFGQAPFISAYSNAGPLTIQDNVFARTEDSNGAILMITAFRNVRITHNLFGINYAGQPLGTTTEGAGVEGQEGVVVGGESASDANTFYGYSRAHISEASVLGNVFTNNGVAITTAGQSPIIRSQTEAGGDTTLSVELDDSYPLGTYRIELFRNPTRRNGLFVQLGDPSGDHAIHGLDTTEFVGFAEVEKTDAGTQTVNATFSATGVTYPTITATVVNLDDSYGRTYPVGYMESEGNLDGTLSTNLGSQKCFQPNTTGDWTVRIENNGTRPAYEFGLTFRYGAGNGPPQSAIDYDAITMSGTATRSDHIGEYADQDSYAETAAMFWEGELLPGQYVDIHLPVAYDPDDIVIVMVDINSVVPANVHDGSVVSEYMTAATSSGNFQVGIALNCQYATDISVTSSVGSAGITPGGNGSYTVTIRNEGAQDIDERPAFTDPLNPGFMSSVSYIALDQGVTPTTMSMPGATTCLFTDPEAFGGGGPTVSVEGCQVLCLNSEGMFSPEIQQDFEESGYSMLLTCYMTVGFPAGSSRVLTVEVSADETVSDSTRFSASVMDFYSFYGNYFPSYVTPENAPFDSDVFEAMTYLQARASYIGDTEAASPFAFMMYPINNNSLVLGIASDTTGEQPDTDPDDLPTGNGGMLMPLGSGGALAESGTPVWSRSAPALLLVGFIVTILRFWRRQRRYVLVG